ncbi:MAG: MOSC domain-containing protein [Actinomycetota bacterium]|nr:MOSC domain-containing protein [Actinomycetota bacterium]
MPVTVSDLAIAPVKGLRVTPAPELEIRETGPVGDRRFVVVDADRRLLRTGRTPSLLQVAPSWEAGSGVLTLRFPGGEEVADVPEPGEAVSTRFFDGRPFRGRLVVGRLSDALSAHLGRPVHLVALDEATLGADDFPVTLMSLGSLASLGAALDGRLPDPRRFRMTITVDGLGAWEEHGWAGREVTLGDVTLRVADPVPRCVVTTHHPDRGKRDAPVLEALAALRGKRDVSFGVWCEVIRPGRVHRGDPVAIPERR